MSTGNNHGLPDSPRLDELKSQGPFNIALIVTAAGGIGLIAGALLEDWKTFSFSFLYGLVWALSISLGGFFWVMIHHVTAAGWSVGIRRTFENMSRAIPFLGVLTLLFFAFGGISGAYKWMMPEEQAALEKLGNGKKIWLSPEFFWVRLLVYFGIWVAYSTVMRNWSLKMDETDSFEERKKILRKCEWWAPSGVALLGLTATFAAFDLIMSLNHHWFSTIFGVIFWADSIRASLATCILTVLAFRAAGYLRHTVTNEHFHDMGKLMFGFTVFWTYVNFAQYFLYWYGNIPEETKFYRDRRYMMMPGSEEISVSTFYTMSIMLPLCYFAVPFFTLLRRDCKRNPKILGFIAGWVLFFHAFHLYWEIMPELHKTTPHDWPSAGAEPNWLIFPAFAFFGGIILLNMISGYRNHAIYPFRDPRILESVHHEVDEFGDTGTLLAANGMTAEAVHSSH
jgi:hypothetical protein